MGTGICHILAQRPIGAGPLCCVCRSWDPDHGLLCVHALRIGDSCGNIRCLLATSRNTVFLGCQVCVYVCV